MVLPDEKEEAALSVVSAATFKPACFHVLHTVRIREQNNSNTLLTSQMIPECFMLPWTRLVELDRLITDKGGGGSANNGVYFAFLGCLSFFYLPREFLFLSNKKSTSNSN
jgi:hypothetical protein